MHMSASLYETDEIVDQYLLFHYGSAGEILPFSFGPRDALDFPARCVADYLPEDGEAAGFRGLDLGCAVGRSAFEMTRRCHEVVAIDYSHKFIEAAKTVQRDGGIDYRRTDEGDLRTSLRATLPAGVHPGRVAFRQGDAQNLPEDLGDFDFVLAANLIDRLENPLTCLRRLPGLVRSGGRLVITSPYTWLAEFTPRSAWLGGKQTANGTVSTKDALIEFLDGAFDLRESRDMPLLIREHARKYQWSVAEATVWQRR